MPIPRIAEDDPLGPFEWYHGTMTRAEAEATLAARGTFLVRRSREQNCCVLSIRNSTGVWLHSLIVYEDGTFSLQGQNLEFRSVGELISYNMSRLGNPRVRDGYRLPLHHRTRLVADRSGAGGRAGGPQHSAAGNDLSPLGGQVLARSDPAVQGASQMPPLQATAAATAGSGGDAHDAPPSYHEALVMEGSSLLVAGPTPANNTTTTTTITNNTPNNRRQPASGNARTHSSSVATQPSSFASSSLDYHPMPDTNVRLNPLAMAHGGSRQSSLAASTVRAGAVVTEQPIAGQRPPRPPRLVDRSVAMGLGLGPAGEQAIVAAGSVTAETTDGGGAAAAGGERELPGCKRCGETCGRGCALCLAGSYRALCCCEEGSVCARCWHSGCVKDSRRALCIRDDRLNCWDQCCECCFEFHAGDSGTGSFADPEHHGFYYLFCFSIAIMLSGLLLLGISPVLFLFWAATYACRRRE